MRSKKVICIPDIQAPAHDQQAVDTAVAIVKGEKPDVVIFIGDLVDFKSISKYKPTDWAESSLTASEEIAAANAVLDQFDRAIPNHAQKVFIEGNHDRRLSLYFVQNATKLGCDFKGISIQEQLHLDKRGFKYVPVGQQPYRIGHLGFIHGWYTNKYHAHKTVSEGRESLMYGHSHDYQVFTGKHLDREAPSIAMSVGCLCQFRQGYLEGRPMNWSHGVGLIQIDEKGYFWPYFVTIMDGRAIMPNGKCYASAR